MTNGEDNTALREQRTSASINSIEPWPFSGEEIEDQAQATPFSPRCMKDVVEETMFANNRNLFSSLDLVFLDTTSIYFEGEGGQEIGERGFSKYHRPDLKQMIVGIVLDNNGTPLCSEMWPEIRGCHNTSACRGAYPQTVPGSRVLHRGGPGNDQQEDPRNTR